MPSVITPCGGGSGVAVAGVRVTHTLAQAIGNAGSGPDDGWTPLAFNTTTFDTAAMHSDTVNNSRLTCTRAGYYAITGNVAFDANATGARWGHIRLNRAVTLSEFNVNGIVGSFTTRVSPLAVFFLSVGDYVEFQVYQTSGGTLNVTGNTANIPMWFSAWSI